MLPPEVREPRRKVFFGVVTSGQPAQLQEARAGRNFAVHYYPILDSLGKVSAVSVFAQDITDRTRAEDELREAHLQLREMTNELPCVVFQFKSDREARGRFTFVGGHVREIDHVDPEAILAEPGLLLKNILPVDRHPHIASLKHAARALAPWRSDFRVRASDGGIRWLHAAAVLRQGPDGTVVWNGYWIDITDRKLAEQALAESRNLLQGILDGTAETLVLLDPLGRILAANTTAAQRVGENPESIQNRDFFSFFPTEISVDRRAAFEASVATGRPKSLDDHRDGRYYALNFYPIRDPQEQTQSVVLFALDITRAKETEASLRESEARFRQHLYGLPIEISICDVKGRVEYANRQYLLNIGYTQHDAGTLAEWWALAAPDPDYRAEVSGRWREATLAVAGSDAAAAMPRAHLRCKDGVYRVFDIVARQMGEQYLVVFSNVTAREEAAAALQRAKEAAEHAALARAQFLATMSHEIRTPLNGIIGMTELAIATATDAEQRRYLQLARSSADSLLGLLNAVLDFSKIEAGRLHPEETSFDLRENIGEVLALLRPQAERKGIAVQVHLDARVPERIISDPLRIRQILTNLLANAIKFTEQGEISLSVDVEAHDELACTLHCRVRDTGIGIAEDRLRSIFSAFVQADGSITRRYGGTGLGLAICARLAEILGGSVWAESKLGFGSTFHCTLRAKLPPLAS
jgi:two-component system sensor histidine kinase/response regulator